MNHIRWLCLCALLCFSTSCVMGINLNIRTNGGLAWPTGQGGEYWKLGFSGGMNLLVQVTGRISIGGSLGYIRMGPDGDALIKMASTSPVGPNGESYDYSLSRTSGSLSIWSMEATVRTFIYQPSSSMIRFFIDCNPGLYFISNKAKVDGRYREGNIRSTISVSPANQSETKPGFSIGLSVQLWKKLEVQPRYTLILSKNEETRFVTFHIGYLVDLAL